jgi:hypothetical protein
MREKITGIGGAFEASVRLGDAVLRIPAFKGAVEGSCQLDVDPHSVQVWPD